MKIEMTRLPNSTTGFLTAKATLGDKKIYSESTLMHHIKQELIKQGHDVIKKRMWKDGHLVDDTIQYIRSRKLKPEPDSIAVHDHLYVIRNLAEDYRTYGEVNLQVLYNFC
jgi:hypothetical protein